MAATAAMAQFAVRQVAASATSTAAAATATPDGPPTCDTTNGYDGRLGVRISAIFVILVGSFVGATFPVYANRHKNVGVPTWAFFIAKYFGSGVIIATAFIHVSHMVPGG